jgi:hypothetical protein
LISIIFKEVKNHNKGLFKCQKEYQLSVIL